MERLISPLKFAQPVNPAVQCYLHSRNTLLIVLEFTSFHVYVKCFAVAFYLEKHSGAFSVGICRRLLALY